MSKFQDIYIYVIGSTTNRAIRVVFISCDGNYDAYLLTKSDRPKRRNLTPQLIVKYTNFQ